MIMSFDDDISNTCLQLGLGLHNLSENCMKREKKKEDEPPKLCNNKAYPSLTLGPIDDDGEEEEEANDQLQASKIIEVSNSPSEVSSFSNSSSIIKKERDHQCLGEEFHEARDHDHVDEDHGNPRKKLRLTKEQSAVLEENFKENSTLNPKQKQELATNLNLRARQVEVWFQNRRARTKLKQTESDCELLKKCCETLTEENQRLQKELQELKYSMQTTPRGSFYMQINPSATLTICPSCERIFGGGSNNNMMLDHHHHFYNNNYVHSTKHHHPQHAS